MRSESMNEFGTSGASKQEPLVDYKENILLSEETQDPPMTSPTGQQNKNTPQLNRSENVSIGSKLHLAIVKRKVGNQIDQFMEKVGVKLDKKDTTFSSIDEKDEVNVKGSNRGKEFEESEESKVSEGEEDDSA